MAKFLIEVPHEATKEECEAAIRIFLGTGSHFLTHADWGCMDGIHKAWMTVDVEDREEARCILPPAYRHRASIISLNQFTLNEARGVVPFHESMV